MDRYYNFQQWRCPFFPFFRAYLVLSRLGRELVHAQRSDRSHAPPPEICNDDRCAVEEKRHAATAGRVFSYSFYVIRSSLIEEMFKFTPLFFLPTDLYETKVVLFFLKK